MKCIYITCKKASKGFPLLHKKQVSNATFFPMKSRNLNKEMFENTFGNVSNHLIRYYLLALSPLADEKKNDFLMFPTLLPKISALLRSRDEAI